MLPRVMAILLLGAAACAAADEIAVTGLRHTVDKSYRRMIEGMDLFDELRARAPGASLRYKLLPRKRDTRIEGISLHIVADSFELPVPIAPDHTFTLPRHRKALAEDASVRPDRKAGTMTWRTQIRTPGLPADTLRLGDLRLECRVGMEAGLVSDDPPTLMGRIMSVLQSADFCDERDVPYLFFSPRALFGVTLSAAGRRQMLSVGQLYAGIAHGRTPREALPYCDCEVLLDRTYYLPLGDRSWPDDTLVELEYMDTPGRAVPEDARPYIAGLGTKADVSAVLGEAAVVRFDSGFEVWAYSFGPETQRLARTELVLLFDPSGVLVKSRLRPAPAPATAGTARLE